MGVLGGMGVVRSMAGSLLWLRCDLGTTADAVTAGLSVRSSLKHKVDTVNKSHKFGGKSVLIVIKTSRNQPPNLMCHPE